MLNCTVTCELHTFETVRAFSFVQRVDPALDLPFSWPRGKLESTPDHAAIATGLCARAERARARPATSLEDRSRWAE
jgi:hypothetical protein